MPIVLNGTTGITTPSYGGVDLAEYIVPVTAFKNRIINGAMVIDQRNAGASVSLSTTTQYPVDRFPSYKGTAGATITAQQRSTANIAHPAGFNNSILYTVSTGSSPAAGDINAFWQTVEGFNVADLNWGTANAQTVTLSFWVRSSITGTYSISLNNSASNRFYVATYTVNSANTWEQKSVTIAGDTSGTWLTDNGLGVQITWDLGYGSNFNGTAGAWGSSTIRRTSGSVTLSANTGATFYITGVQLEVGSTATSFDYRPYGTELALCQRYYFRKDIATADSFAVLQAYSTGAAFGKLCDLPVTMRATPIGSLSAIGSFRGGNANGTGAVAFTGGAIDSVSATSIGTAGFTGASGLAAGNATVINVNPAAWIAASAEL